MRERIEKLIIELIQQKEEGSVFVANDFLSFGSLSSVNRALSRINEKGLIKRLEHGLYAKLKFDPLLDEFTMPNINDVALAIARKNAWTILPCGDNAKFQLGLIPYFNGIYEYASNGPYRTYLYENNSITFKRTSSKSISNLSFKTGLLIQTIKAIGKSNIKEKDIRLISSKLSRQEKDIALEESKRVQAWIYDLIKLINQL